MAIPFRKFSVYSDGSIYFDQPIRYGTWAVVMHDFDRVGMSRPDVNNDPQGVRGLPETCRLYNAKRVALTKELQEYWFGLLKQAAGNATIDLIKAWTGLLKNGRAYTDHAQNANTANYITDPKSGKPPIGFNPIITGGNVVEILDSAHIYDLGGKRLFRIQVFDVTSPLYVNLAKFHIIGHATNSVRDLDGRRVDPFPQLGGRPIPVPYFSHGENYIEVDRVRILSPYEPFPNPYVPARL